MLHYSLLENGTYSDAKIECLKHIWNVHRTILCTRSPWFAEEFRKNMEVCGFGAGAISGTRKRVQGKLLTRLAIFRRARSVI